MAFYGGVSDLVPSVVVNQCSPVVSTHLTCNTVSSAVDHSAAARVGGARVTHIVPRAVVALLSEEVAPVVPLASPLAICAGIN